MDVPRLTASSSSDSSKTAIISAVFILS
jgi:hypothetical protein